MTTLKHLKVSAEQNKASYEIAMNDVDPSLLESFDNPMILKTEGAGLLEKTIKITAPEFTSLCPITSQPDFATIGIEYSPKSKCVESKSLKLYLLSYRNHKGFHEDCVAKIGNDLIDLLDPLYLKVIGEFTPRGGISFHPIFEFYNVD